jgi:alpha-galactosidase
MLQFRIVEDSPAFQQRIIVSGKTEGLILHELHPYDYTLETDGLQAIAYFMRGCKHQGVTQIDAAEIPYEDFRMEAGELGRVYLKSGRRATEEMLPYMLVHEIQNRTGLFFGVQWSGHWFMDALNLNGAQENLKKLRICGGPDEFSHKLVPGGIFSSPWCYIGMFSGQIDDGFRAHNDFLKKAIMPVPRFDSPPVTYNHWYAMEKDIKEHDLYKEADIASELEVDYFIIDDGWYGNSQKSLKNKTESDDGMAEWFEGAGNWNEDRAKFPSGLKAFSEYVHSKGMKFGIWIEPERVDITTGNEGGWNSEWLAGDEDGKPHELKYKNARTNGWLCFAHESVREWAKDWICRLIEKYEIDWIKWDSNWWTICRNPIHGHQEGDGEYAHIEGVYEVYEYLLEKYPELVIENCAGGGTRMDTGIMRYSHIHWVDDETDLPQKVRAHCSRLSAYMPSQNIYTFFCPPHNEKADFSEFTYPGTTNIEKDLVDYKMRSCMLGVWGLSYRLSSIPREAYGQLKKNIDEYKKIRQILCKGNFINILPVGFLMRPYLKTNSIEIYEFVLEDKSAAIVFVFSSTINSDIYIKPRGLDESAMYILKNIEGLYVGGFSGNTLANKGFHIKIEKDLFSEIFLISKTN